ncbi:hypothetical protein ACLOJK_014478, partial [Asimina triloba]
GKSPSFDTDEKQDAGQDGARRVATAKVARQELQRHLEMSNRKTCALHDGINDEICIIGIDFGGIHGRHGHLDGFPEGPFPEIQRLTAIREALQMVGNMLSSLQGGDSRSKLMINDAVQEESRQIKKPIMAFIKSCIWILLYPLKLPKAATLAGRFAAVMAGAVSVYLLYRSRQQRTIRGTETPYPTQEFPQNARKFS